MDKNVVSLPAEISVTTEQPQTYALTLKSDAVSITVLPEKMVVLGENDVMKLTAPVEL